MTLHAPLGKLKGMGKPKKLKIANHRKKLRNTRKITSHKSLEVAGYSYPKQLVARAKSTTVTSLWKSCN